MSVDDGNGCGYGWEWVWMCALVKGEGGDMAGNGGECVYTKGVRVCMGGNGCVLERCGGAWVGIGV